MVIKIDVDKDMSINTLSYPLMRFKYPKFNPVQSAFLSIYDLNANSVISASTSAGKTAIAEMAFADALLKGKKCIYLVPLRALAQEKIDDWSSPEHPFSKKKLAIATGDYLLPENRERILKSCQLSDITVMTSELLDSLTRRIEKMEEWFSKVGVIVVDEAHLLTIEKRGGALECALMRFSSVSDARIILLSATMPNTEELADWLCELNGKNTYLIESDWRPCVLGIHYVQYPDRGLLYEDKIDSMLDKAIEILYRHISDKFIVFVHSKNVGKKLLSSLKELGISAEFHNANVELKNRLKLTEDFKNKNSLRVLVATSTLAWGINLPARRVLVAGVNRGLEEVSVLDLKQMVGRAGRVGLDLRGDAYVLIPESESERYNGILDNLPEIESRLSNIKELAFHIVNEINEGTNTVDKLWKWFKGSFAVKRGSSKDLIENVVDELVKWDIIRDSETGIYTPTPIGKISSWFYYSPFTIALLKSNFQGYIGDDIDLAWAIGSAMWENVAYTSIDYYEDMLYLKEKLRSRYKMPLKADEINIYAIYLLLIGEHEKKPEMLNVVRGFQADISRLTSALKALGSFYNIKYDFDELAIRLQYGINSELVPLCKLQGIGVTRAKKLASAGIKSYSDILNRSEEASKILGGKLYQKIAAKIKEKTENLSPV
jgi:helicase